jgi:hypothetical protein
LEARADDGGVEIDDRAELLSVSGDANNHNLPQSGRLLYCVH